MKSLEEKATKKTYNSPQLHVYGDIRTVTQTNDMTGVDDNSMNSGMDKT